MKPQDLLPSDLVSALDELLDDYETNEAQGGTLGISWADHCASVAIQWGAAKKEATVDTGESPEIPASAKLTIRDVLDYLAHREGETAKQAHIFSDEGSIELEQEWSGRFTEVHMLYVWIEQQMQEGAPSAVTPGEKPASGGGQGLAAGAEAAVTGAAEGHETRATAEAS